MVEVSTQFLSRQYINIGKVTNHRNHTHTVPQNANQIRNFFFFEKWIQTDILIKEMRILQYKRQDIRWNTLQPNMRG